MKTTPLLRSQRVETLEPKLLQNNIIFTVDNNSTEILRLEPNGDIYVRGKLIENDKEVVDGLREFLKLSNLF